MKKSILIVLMGALLTSCAIERRTARTEVLPYAMYNATIADLDVAAERITYTFVPSKAIARLGIENCKKAAIQEALRINGNADLLVEPEFVICGTMRKAKSVTVSGRPAKYKNFRSFDDKVWCDPIFRGTKTETHIFKSDDSFKPGTVELNLNNE